MILDPGGVPWGLDHPNGSVPVLLERCLFRFEVDGIWAPGKSGGKILNSPTPHFIVFSIYGRVQTVVPGVGTPPRYPETSDSTWMLGWVTMIQR